jgi:hypothetical protein
MNIISMPVLQLVVKKILINYFWYGIYAEVNGKNNFN